MKEYILTFFVIAAGAGGLGVVGTKIFARYGAQFRQYIDRRTLDDSDEVEVEHLLQENWPL